MTRSLCAWCTNKAPRYSVAMAWLGLNLLLFWRTYEYYKHDPKFYYLHELLGAGLCISRGTANVINLNLGVLLLPMCRAATSAIRSLNVKIPKTVLRACMNRCKGFHIFCAFIVALASVVHFIGHVYNAYNFSENYNPHFRGVNAAQYPKQDPLLLVLTSVPGVTGVLLMAVLSLIFSSAIANVRYANYDLFWYVHRLWIVFYLLVVFHAYRGILRAQTNIQSHTPGCMMLNMTVAFPEPAFPEPEMEDKDAPCDTMPQFDTIGCSTWLWVCVPLLMYSLDLTYRVIIRCKSRVQVVNIIPHPAEVLEIQLMQHGLKVRPGQFVLLHCPEVSSFEYHPYTVSRVPTLTDPSFTVHMKVVGDWSGRLRERLYDPNEDTDDCDLLIPTNIHNLRLYLEGPFGSPMEDILRYKVCLCVAGGIGITPFAAFMNSLLYEEGIGSLERLYLVWVVRGVESFFCFVDLICDLYKKFWDINRPDAFEVQLYITGQYEVELESLFIERHSVLIGRTFTGRPDWHDLLRKIATSYPRRDVGVFTCGPKSLTRTLEKWCLRLRTGGTTFHCSNESF